MEGKLGRSTAELTLRFLHQTLISRFQVLVMARAVHLEPAEEEPVKLIGIVLIVVGICALALGSISYIDRDKVVDLGPLEVTTEQRKSVPLSPILGIGALVGGLVLVAVGSKSRA